MKQFALVSFYQLAETGLIPEPVGLEKLLIGFPFAHYGPGLGPRRRTRTMPIAIAMAIAMSDVGIGVLTAGSSFLALAVGG